MQGAGMQGAGHAAYAPHAEYSCGSRSASRAVRSDCDVTNLCASDETLMTRKPLLARRIAGRRAATRAKWPKWLTPIVRSKPSSVRRRSGMAITPALFRSTLRARSTRTPRHIFVRRHTRGDAEVGSSRRTRLVLTLRGHSRGAWAPCGWTLGWPNPALHQQCDQLARQSPYAPQLQHRQPSLAIWPSAPPWHRLQPSVWRFQGRGRCLHP